jgi:glucose dehydrogenase
MLEAEPLSPGHGAFPAGSQATPKTYWSDASPSQFVVIAAGGNAALHSPKGDSIVAYTLPTPNN